MQLDKIIDKILEDFDIEFFYLEGTGLNKKNDELENKDEKDVKKFIRQACYAIIDEVVNEVKEFEEIINKMKTLS